jgi:cytoskeletal protein CcmA (bactofilin family)
MEFFRRNKNNQNNETVESIQVEKLKPGTDSAHRSTDPKPCLDDPQESSPQRVGIVSGDLSTSAESDGLSQFGAVVERRFGPGSERDPLPPRHAAADGALNPSRDAFDENEARRTLETDLDDEDAESPKLEVDPMGLIGHATTITGDIVAKEDLEIQGTIDGSVRLVDHRVTVGSDGIVNAAVEAHSVLVIGKITGDVIATELVEIKAGGVIGGDVKAPRVIMNDGAIVIGGLDMSAALPLGEASSSSEPPASSEPPSSSESPTPDRLRLMRVELSNGPTSKESI